METSRPMSATTTIPSPYEDAQFYDGVPVRRLIAFLIDSVVTVLLMTVIVVVGFVVGLLTFGLGWVVAALLFVSADFLYRWLTITSSSATWGMAACGIELRDMRGERLDAGQALFHTGAYYLSVALAIPLLLNLLIMFISPHRRLIHDFLLGTVMINRPQ